MRKTCLEMLQDRGYVVTSVRADETNYCFMFLLWHYIWPVQCMDGKLIVIWLAYLSCVAATLSVLVSPAIR